jgi:glycosyltransferase involved in cell wall biosynthesis
MPELAVLIAAYNAQDALARTLRSLDRQSGDFDILVVDDCSSPPMLVDQSAYSHRIQLIRLKSNRGPFVAANEGLRQIMQGSYKFVARQDAGDVDIENRLEMQLAFMKAHPNIAIVGAWVRFTDGSGSPMFDFQPPLDTQGIRRRMRYGTAFIHPASMIRLDALRNVGLYHDEYQVKNGFAGGDYDLFCRLAYSFECANIPRVLVIKEEDRGISVSIDKRRESVRSRIRTQLRYFSWTTSHSYIGLVYSFFMYAVPYKLLAQIKMRQKVVG